MKLKRFFLSICILIGGYQASFGVDIGHFKKKYNDADYVVLNREVVIDYFFDSESQTLKAKSKHQLSILSLAHGVEEMKMIQVPFSQYEKVKLLSAKYFRITKEGGREIRDNIKVKYAEEKDFFVQGIFYNDLKVKQFASSLPLLDSTLLEYSYEIIYEDLKFLNRIYAQQPGENVEQFSLQINRPDFVDAQVRSFNIGEEDLAPLSTAGSQISIQLNDLTDQSGFYNNVPTNYYLPHFVVVTNGYEWQGTRKTILGDVSDLYGWYHSLINELNPDKESIQSLADQISSNSAPEVQISQIYNWVQSNINYVAFEDGIAGFKPEEADQVAKLRYGDCKGMANLLVELLKAKGFDARRTWIGTRRINYDYSLPSLVVDNHMICALKLKDKTYFLDATDKHAKWNVAGAHIQGKMGLIEDGGTFELLQVPIANASKNTTNISVETSLDINSKDGRLKIIGKLSSSGEPYSRILYTKTNLNSIAQSWMHLDVPDHYLENYKSLPMDKSESLKEIPLDGYASGYTISSDDRLFLFMDLNMSFHDTKGLSVNKLYLPACEKQVFINRFKMPAGANVRQIPEDIIMNGPEGEFSVLISYKKEGGYLIYSKEVKINRLFVDTDKIDPWLHMIGSLNQSYQTPVILEL